MAQQTLIKSVVLDPSRVFPRIVPAPKDADMLPPDYFAVASILFAFAGLYLGIRALAWAACFALLSSFLTRSKSEFDRIQTIISAVVSVFVLTVAYTDPSSV